MHNFNASQVQTGLGSNAANAATEQNVSQNKGISGTGQLGSNSETLANYSDGVVFGSNEAPSESAAANVQGSAIASNDASASQAQGQTAQPRRVDKAMAQTEAKALGTAPAQSQQQQNPGDASSASEARPAARQQQTQVIAGNDIPQQRPRQAGYSAGQDAATYEGGAEKAPDVHPLPSSRRNQPVPSADQGVAAVDEAERNVDWRQKVKEAKPKRMGGFRMHRFAKSVKDSVKNALSGKRVVPSGDNLNSKAVSSPGLGLSIQDVSVGTDAMLELIRNDTTFLDRVNKKSEEYVANRKPGHEEFVTDFKVDDFVGGDSFDSDYAAAAMGAFMDQVNKLNINVVVSKSPISEKSSTQIRRVRMHVGQGIAIHPLAAKGFTADFDGDGITVHFGTRFFDGAENCMEYLRGIDGKSLIDLDFFPMPHIDDASEFASNVLPGVKNADALAKACNKKDADEIARLIEQEYPVTEDMDYRQSNSMYINRARLIDRLYTHMLEKHRQGILDISVESNFIPPEKLDAIELTPEDMVLQQIISDAVKGQMPPNYQQFVSDLARFNGDIAGKNPHFRIGADLGKLMKFDQFVFVGESDMKKLWIMSCAAANAKIMANKVFATEKKTSRAEWKKLYVIERAKVPVDRDGNAQDFNAWYEKFRDAYNSATYIQDVPKDQYRSDMRVIGDEMAMVDDDSGRNSKYLPPLNELRAGTLAKAYVEIYGDFTIDRLFKHCIVPAEKPGKLRSSLWNSAVSRSNMISSSGNRTLSRFAADNNFVVPSESYKEQMTGNARDNSMGLYDHAWAMLFNAIADMSNSKASDYNNILEKNLDAQLKVKADVANDIRNMRDPERYDAVADLKIKTDMLAACGEDMYAYFGMDSVESFWNSEWGKLMLKAKSADQLGGIRYAMTFEMRTHRAARLVEALASKEADTEEVKAAIASELAVLGSSSKAWDTIVSELSSKNELWKELWATKSVSARLGDAAHSNAFEAGVFKSEDRWGNIFRFIGDPTVGKNEKDMVLSDLVRMKFSNMSVSGFHMAYQLEMSPSSTYSGSNTQGYSERSDDVLRESLNDMVKEQDNEFIAQGMSLKPEDLKLMLSYLDKPWNSYRIADDMYADAITASLEKSYSDTEKSQQQAAVNALYTAISTQRNGGIYSDVYRGDDRATGRIGAKDLRFSDVLHLLANPGEYLDVYDQYGNITRMDRDSICRMEDGRHASDDDVLAFFRKNPRLFGHLRTMQANCSSDTDGSSFTSAAMDVNTTLRAACDSSSKSKLNQAERKALYYMRDHPGWGALIALHTPAHGASGLAYRSKVMQSERNMLVAMAYERIHPGTMSFSSIGRFDKDLPGVASKLVSNYSEEIFNDRKDAVEYLDLLKANGRSNSYPRFSFDNESVRMFYDVRQVLSGAKTSVSTGVEGAETDRFAPMVPFLAACENPYTMRDGQVVEKDAEDGRAHGQLKKLFTGSAAKFLAIKRSKGGEEFNLKAKKAGDDGLDSITKSYKFNKSEDWEGALASIRQAYETGGRMAADIALGERLMGQNKAIGYEGMDEAEYANIAHLMIVEVDGGIQVRSLGQLCNAVRSKLPLVLDTVDFDNVQAKDIVDASSAIIDSVDGSTEANIMDILYSMRIPGKSRFKPVVRARLNSYDRNFEAMVELAKLVEQDPNAEFLTDDKAAMAFNEVKKRISKDELNKLEWARKSGTYNIVGHVSKSGRFSGTKAPGARNVVWLADGASDEAVDAAVDMCRRFGMTLACTNASSLRRYPEIVNSIVTAAPGSNWKNPCVIAPFFEQHVNGSGETKSGTWFFSDNNVVVSVEDSLNQFGLGDASCMINSDFGDRISVDKRGVWSDNVNDMFADYIELFCEEFKDACSFEFSVATDEEIAGLLESENPMIDLRVSSSNSDYESIAKKMQVRMREFNAAFKGNGNKVPSEGRPDRIIGFAKMSVLDESGTKVEEVYAPLIPFPSYLGNTKTSPQLYDVIGDIAYDGEKGAFNMSWTSKSSLKDMPEGQFLKMFEGLAAGNKMMTYTGDMFDNMSLVSGRSIDVVYAANTTASRRLGWNARLQTMYSMMLQARMEAMGGYNFAEGSGSFPDNPDLKMALMSGEVSTQEWLDFIESGARWHIDNKINAFLKSQVSICIRRGINPSDFLCSRYQVTTESGEKKWASTHKAFEFDMLFKPGLNYQSNLMYFMNSMMPNLCPPGFESLVPDNMTESDRTKRDSQYLFRPSTEDGWSYGALQMQVPRVREDGITRYTWENVYTSFGFFSDDYSGFHSPGADGADIMMQELAAAMQAGDLLDNKRLLGAFMKWAYRDAGGAPKPTQWSASDYSFNVPQKEQ